MNGLQSLPSLEEPLPYPGPDGFAAVTGCVAVGEHADGSVANWSLWDQHGARHGLVVGEAASGVSGLLNVLVTGAAHSGLVVPWVIDVQGGGLSWPAWVRAAHSAVDASAAVRMLADAERIAAARRACLIERGAGSWQPGGDMPLLLLVVDDAYELRHTCAGGYLDRLISLGRSVGISVVFGSRSASSDTLVNHRIRGGLLTGDIAVLRTTDLFAREILPGLPGDPRDLPRLPGAGFLLNRPNPLFRAYHLGDPSGWAPPRTELEAGALT